MRRRFSCSRKKTKWSRLAFTGLLMLSADAVLGQDKYPFRQPGEKRVISLRDAYHNDPIEGAGLADFYRALDWLLPKTSLPQAP